MEIFFNDPNEVRLPPEEVRLREMQVIPLPDGRRVRILLELTPFMKRPNVDISITGASGREAAHASILETMSRKLEFVLHLRETEPGSEYTLESMVYYQRLPESSNTSMEMVLPEPIIVDRQKATFILPQSNT
jgi:hypothetical protein